MICAFSWNEDRNSKRILKVGAQGKRTRGQLRVILENFVGGVAQRIKKNFHVRGLVSDLLRSLSLAKWNTVLNSEGKMKKMVYF